MSRLYNFTAESSTYEGIALIFTLHLKKKKPPNETRNMKSSKQLMGINKEKKKDTRRKTIKREKKRPLRRKSDHVAPSTALMAERNSNTKHTKREKKKKLPKQ